MEKKYLRFKKLNVGNRKTSIYQVFNTNHEFIAVIKWNSGWRRYVTDFDGFPVIIDENCHREFADFIKGLMEDRKRRFKKKA